MTPWPRYKVAQRQGGWSAMASENYLRAVRPHRKSAQRLARTPDVRQTVCQVSAIARGATARGATQI